MLRQLRRLRDIATIHLPRLAKVELLRLFPNLWDAIEFQPDAAWLNPTDNCNMRCIMCNQWRETKTNELTTAEWRMVLDQLADFGIKKCGFNGGEPLLRKDLPEIFSHVTSRGMKPALITSGYLLDDSRLEALLDAGMVHATLSIDGVGDEYEKIRGREWSRVEAAARRLGRAYQQGRLDANIGFVIMKQTLEHLPRVKTLCAEVGLPLAISLVDSTPFFFQLPENQMSAANSNWIGPEDRDKIRTIQKALVEMKASGTHSVVNSWSSLDYIDSYFKDPLQAAIPCSVAQLRVMINSRGEVYGGCWSMGAYGSLRERTLKDILSSPEYRAAHRAMFYKDCPGCSCGFSTNLQYSLRTQVENRVYDLVPSQRPVIFEPAA
jgi:MoaA/NifB/PqqE/SkfB family radical SAM enzyme